MRGVLGEGLTLAASCARACAHHCMPARVCSCPWGWFALMGCCRIAWCRWFVAGEELLCNKGHHGPVYGTRFAPDGKTYASGGDDGTIRIWTFAEEAAEVEAPAAAEPGTAPASATPAKEAAAAEAADVVDSS